MADHAPDPIVGIAPPEQPFPTAPNYELGLMQRRADALAEENAYLVGAMNDAWTQFRAVRNAAHALGITDKQINEHLTPIPAELQAKIMAVLTALAAAEAK